MFIKSFGCAKDLESLSTMLLCMYITTYIDAEVGDLELTPVSTAIARYLGIDLTAEGRAARNRRGIVILVHGAPLSGKTATAKDLAAQFETALLTIDDVVLQALQSGISAASTFYFVCLYQLLCVFSLCMF